jgi:hypothetical protein
MVADALKLPPDYFGALEFIAGAFCEAVNYIKGMGGFEANLAGAFPEAVHSNDPDCGPQCPTGTSAQADTACQSRRHDHMHVGCTQLLRQ